MTDNRASDRRRAASPAPDADPVTQPRPRDAAGRELASDGLPLSGPARAAALAAQARANDAITLTDKD